jgi:hypothetical protein
MMMKKKKKKKKDRIGTMATIYPIYSHLEVPSKPFASHTNY